MASSTSVPLLVDCSSLQVSELHGSQPSLSLREVILEIKMLCTIAFPLIITGLLVYGKSMISMFFLGKLGKNVLAGGSLAIGIANITGYSVISGLALGMEAIAAQAFGGKQWPLMSQALQRTVIILLSASIPISFLWLNIQPILVFCNQDPTISSIAATYLMFCLPDLVFQSLINPLRIYLRSQNITAPLMFSAALALALHVPVNYFLVCRLSLGIRGIALAVVITDFAMLATLMVYLLYWLWWGGGVGVGRGRFCVGINFDERSKCCCCCWFDDEWRSLLNLSLPSCVSVCLEWWWYELMILMSGILPNAAETVATMGILIQVTSLVYIFPSSLSSAASTRVGNELGANRPRKARISSLVALLCAVLTSVVAMSFMVTLGGKMWARTFTGDDAIVAITATVMPVVGLCELGNCPQTTLCGVLRGSARPSLGLRVNLVSFYGVGFPLAIFMGFAMKMGLLGLWLGLLGAQAVCATVMVLILSRTNWIVEANRAMELIRNPT